MTEITRREYLAVASLGILGLAASMVYRDSSGCANAAVRRRPNLIFILVDDLGWMDVGYMGGKLFETLNIDRLAAQGMKFTNAYAAAPLCSPTRASILTGKSPARLHLTFAIHANPKVKRSVGHVPEPSETASLQ